MRLVLIDDLFRAALAPDTGNPVRNLAAPKPDVVREVDPELGEIDVCADETGDQNTPLSACYAAAVAPNHFRGPSGPNHFSVRRAWQSLPSIGPRA